MSRRKGYKMPFTSWLLIAYCAALALKGFVGWLLGVEQPDQWLLIGLYSPLFLLWWWDSLRRADAEVQWQEDTIKQEVAEQVAHQAKQESP